MNCWPGDVADAGEDVDRSGGDGFAGLGLSAQLVTALEHMGAEDPTRVQRMAIPPALTGRDLAAVAPTGTGKTLAYLTPLAQRLLREPPPRKRGQPVDPRRRLRALVLCPTRELAQQVAREAQQLLRGSVLRADAVYGKSALPPQRAVVRKGLDLLVGTPGRVRELCEEDSLSLAFVRQVVMDEADRMLDMGFLPQAQELLSRTPASRQLLFFTATMPRPIEKLVEEMLRDPVRVDVSQGAPARVVGTPNPRQESDHLLYDVADEHKSALTVALVKDAQRKGVIVFCRTRRRAGWVAQAMRRHGISTALLHGDRSQRQRQQALDEFARGEARVLVATDVAARGLHVPVVRTVVNYDVPLMPEDYVHRVGRAGHGGGFAEAISFRTAADAPRWSRVQRAARIEVSPTVPPKFQAYLHPAMVRAPDTERPAPKKRPGKKEERAKRREAAANPSLATIIRRGPKALRGSRGGGGKGGAGAAGGGAGGGGDRTSRGGARSRGSQRKRPLGKGQKPGGGVRKIG
jgi:ATP-dependent RNA helicase RhlE